MSLRLAPRAEHLSVVSKKLGAPVRRLAGGEWGADVQIQLPANAIPLGPMHGIPFGAVGGWLVVGGLQPSSWTGREGQCFMFP